MSEQSATPHRPVLLTEAVTALQIKPAGVYVDCTFGRGGHSAAILQQLGPQGRVFAMDQDPEAIAHGRRMFENENRISIERGSFTMLEQLAGREGIIGRIDGILLDLGVSSPQLDTPSRGFSFLADGPLDMRMDPEVGQSAADWLAVAGEAEISRVLRDYGEERFHKRIARAIVRQRDQQPLTRTQQLADLVTRAIPKKELHKHAATRSFQAIRIFINRELDVLSEVLEQCLRVLALGGRLVVISFHSLEDRLVKRFMRQHSRGPELPPDLPIMGEPGVGPLQIIGKPVRAGDAECRQNPRARSAIMRIAQRREATV